MPRLARLAAVLLLAAGAVLHAQTGAGPAAASAPALGAPKPFPYPFSLPRPPADELKARRAALAKDVKDGAVVLVSSEKPALASHRYSPDHNVYYFTGIDTDFCAMTLVAKDGKIADLKLFLPTADPGYELWNGKRVCAGDEAKALSGIDEVVKVQESQFGKNYKPFEKALAEIARSARNVWLDVPGGKGSFLELPVRAMMLEEAVKAANPRLDVEVLGHDSGAPWDSPISTLRGVKSPWEIGVIREAIRVTGDGFVRAIRQVRPKMWEFDFQAVMHQTFDEFGCTGVPYFPIAASGPNACVYHYTDNRRQVQDGEIILCDIAAEFGYYAADITRSFPANGKFTDRQKLVYEAVLAGQTAAAEALKPGVTMGELNDVAKKAMIAAGLKPFEAHQHGLGHHVGLDVHDPGPGMRPGMGVLKPGMIVTIEPGAYIKSESLGIRIEDMYLVTADGSECLSAAIPRTVAELEALVGADWKK
jgi:Xaa-Pro aminopeptidase